MTETQLAVFKGKKIRKSIHKTEWWLSIIDVCEALTESVDAGAYWRQLKQRLNKEGSEVVTFCHGLKMQKDFMKVKSQPEKAERLQVRPGKTLKKRQANGLFPVRTT